MNFTPEQQILLWAAGAGTEVPTVAEVDEAALIDLLVTHRMVHRLLARLAEGRPNWYIAARHGDPPWCNPKP